MCMASRNLDVEGMVRDAKDWLHIDWGLASARTKW